MRVLFDPDALLETREGAAFYEDSQPGLVISRNTKQKFEPTWIGKENRLKLEPPPFITMSNGGKPYESGCCLGDGLISLSVGFQDADESRDFEFELCVDGRGIVECVKAADSFETSGGERDLGRA